MAETSLKMAMVGCGGIARAHWHGIQNHAPRIDVTAVVDVDEKAAKEFAETVGARAYTSLERCLYESGVDAVDLMLPHHLHEWAATVCFRAKKDVILEKPIAMDTVTAERILNGAKRAEIKLMVAEQAQYWMDVVEARELIDRGEIGDIVTGKACFYDPLRPFDKDNLPWRFSLEKAGGGISIDGGAHWIRPMRMMLGEIEEVVAATGRFIPEMEGESIAQAILRFDSGVIGTFQAIQSTGRLAPIEDFRITGTKGEIVIERGRQGRLMLYNADYLDGKNVMSAFESKAASYGVELADFASYVLDDTPLAAPPEYALGELRTAIAMYRSVSTGRWEKVW
ncbi:MAG: Gfo/Idh/MocA family oxidoreductase [Gammaproteobacteria bacterium]|nr:Gfo/Idh/MocA family oxidoreductase [Gammaproteobacteria bacterium]